MVEQLKQIEVYFEKFPLLESLVAVFSLIFTMVCVHYIVKFAFFRIMGIFAKKLPFIIREVLHEKELFQKLSLFAPLVVFYTGVAFVPSISSNLVTLLQKMSVVGLIIVGLNVINFIFSELNDAYIRFDIARSRPIKGYLQVVSIILYLLGFVICISTLLDRSPLVFLSGLGALTAVLLLVFRDTLLSLVAGVQLTTNNLIRVGDWIEMPQFSADGDVIDIALHTVKVQNWDRTITVIPTHKFLEHSFKNWRGMQEAGGRRIKRSINIDMSTVRFLTNEEIDRFSNFALLEKYIEQKKEELIAHNKQFESTPFIANSRRLTNVGTFRAYIVNYLKQHPKIHQNMSFLVRHLQPTVEGLPLEIYVFANDIAWSNYENIQADIFDHILAIAHEFQIAIYQKPSGYNLANPKYLSE